jgi:protein-L-isoaspartate(D-aspartate) O-methyltransferase
MVERLKTSRAIRSPSVEQAFRTVLRHQFLPGVALDLVYSGNAIVTRSDPVLGITSSSSEVAIMAPMLEALQLEGGERVLEIGAGTGYNAALLDELVGPEGEVTTIDNQENVIDDARAHLVAAGRTRVRVVVGDGYAGWADAAPYDRIMATASVRDIPLAWRDQLREGAFSSCHCASVRAPRSSRRSGGRANAWTASARLGVASCRCARMVSSSRSRSRWRRT